MSKQDRLTWISRGSPFTLMRPAAKLRDRLRAHGYIVYDIGNRQHLEHEPPEDHTPYSETGWPGRAKYGVGYAIDIMPPKPGQKSKLTGKPLPSLQQLGARMVADRKAGVPGIRWLKYQNWEPERDWDGPCYQDSWKPNYARRSSSDRGHIHQSGATGYETSTIGDDYDPVARIYGEDDDMPLSDTDLSKIRSATAKGIYDALHIAATGRDFRDLKYVGEGAIGASIRGNLTTLTVAPVLAAIAAAGQVDERTLAAELAPALAAAVVAALPEDRDDVSVDDLAEALRRVLGSVDGATPAGG